MSKDITPRGAVEVYGARVHNLKNIDVTIPHGSLSVITGLSGSGKSSLAFDTIYAEGQRRYIETFSSYARGMLGALERPDVDKITGLSPVISIEQKTVNRNPRSTIGTTTEIYDFLRLLYARLGEAYSHVSGKKMVKYTSERIFSMILDEYAGRKVYIMAPVVKNRKGHYRELLENLRKKGYLRARIDGEITELTYGLKLDRYKNHSIELVVDRMKVSEDDRQRLQKSVETALVQGSKQMIVYDVESDELRYFSQMLMDDESGISYAEPAPHSFSFNSPLGACPKCKGLGFVEKIDRSKIMPDTSKSIKSGGILPLGRYSDTLIFRQIDAICRLHGCTIETPIRDLPEEAIDEILHGTTQRLDVSTGSISSSWYGVGYDGIVKYLEAMHDDDTVSSKWSGKFFSRGECPDCHGARLNPVSLQFRIDGKNIAQVAAMDMRTLYEWTEGLEDRVEQSRRSVAVEILKEIRTRVKFLLDIGLDYLSLDRRSATLSGGESQRIRLATQIGSQLVNVLYVLDEPSIGLHSRDNDRLIGSLQQLRDNGNSIIVVEHDKEIMTKADYIVDIGPGAGDGGGEVLFQGSPADMLKTHTLTAQYLNSEKQIEVPAKRREGNGKTLTLRGARGHNLQDVTIELPLGKMICFTGVSGSGKSSLVNGTLQPILSAKLHRAQTEPLPYDSIDGLKNIDKVVTVDQSPLGRSPRSNPATYTGVFNDIRNLFAQLPESQIRGYKSGRFSFNVSGGRCETCKGNGYRTIEMNFLPDVLVPCESCRGKRYNRETLEVRYKGKTIADVLDMTIDKAVDFFVNVPPILRKIKVLQEIGLGYLKLGRPSATLSGGENQRVKLATELARRDTGKTLFILDEPTTGLHFEDVKTLLALLNKLVDRGNTVVIIEHNMDVIKSADYIFDLGPEGGVGGGRVVACGTPEEVAQQDTFTGRYLRAELERR